MSLERESRFVEGELIRNIEGDTYKVICTNDDGTLTIQTTEGSVKIITDAPAHHFERK